jgi:hypothetical protein
MKYLLRFIFFCLIYCSFIEASHALTKVISTSWISSRSLRVPGQRIKYSGYFKNTTYAVEGNVLIEILFEPNNKVSGYVNFTNSPGKNEICGAGNFEGSIENNVLNGRFVSDDPDPGCGFDKGLIFLLNATLSPDGNRLENGTYQINNSQAGVFQAVAQLRAKAQTIANAKATEIKINYETPSFQERAITLGNITAIVSYEKIKSYSSTNDPKNLRYQLLYDGILKFAGNDYTSSTGNVSLLDLDADGIPEIIVQNYSGGAHCCTNTKIYQWQNDKFQHTETGGLDGKGGNFEDLDGDGKQEFISSDKSFLYAFSSYAASFPPSAIYTYQKGKLQPVTRRYPKQLRSTLNRMFQLIHKGEEVNGVLAGYVAQKILLGEYEQGWSFMLANYDRSPKLFQGFRMKGTSDFPSALRSLLIERGYLDAQGRPTKISP